MSLGKHSYSLSPQVEERSVVENYTSIAGGVTIHLDDNHACIAHREYVSCYPFAERWGVDYAKTGSQERTVKIGSDVWIGEDAHLLAGVTVGDGAIIAAHSVVTKDVPSFALVAGNPARIKRYRFSKKIIEKLLKIQWWGWEDRIIRECMEDFKDIKKFVKKYG